MRVHASGNIPSISHLPSSGAASCHGVAAPHAASYVVWRDRDRDFGRRVHFAVLRLGLSVHETASGAATARTSASFLNFFELKFYYMPLRSRDERSLKHWEDPMAALSYYHD